MNRKAVLADVVVVLLSLHSKEPLFHTLIYIYNIHIHTHTDTFSTPKARKRRKSVIYRTDEQISSDLGPDIRSDSGVF